MSPEKPPPSSTEPATREPAPTCKASSAEPKLRIEGLSLWYGKIRALADVSLEVPSQQVTALIGPSGCGKSSLLRTLNRLNDRVPGVRYAGHIWLHDRNGLAGRAGLDILDPATDLTALRQRVGMVFQRPNPFPLSVFENIAFGLRLRGASAAEVSAAVEASLQAVGLWDKLGSQLDEDASTLSPEQQQRLCLARALATQPEVLLLDEPCSTLDPQATQHIEKLIRALAERYTIVIVTHNMQQARRVADQTAYLLLGQLIEAGATETLFSSPRDQRTAGYVSGEYG